MKKNKLQVNKKDTSEQEINVISKASRRAWTTFGVIAFILSASNYIPRSQHKTLVKS